MQVNFSSFVIISQKEGISNDTFKQQLKMHLFHRIHVMVLEIAVWCLGHVKK